MKTTLAQGKKLSFPNKKFRAAALLLALLPLFSLHSATTYSTATANFSLTTATIQAASIVAPAAISMNVTTATAGQSPNSVSDSTTTYGLSTNVSTVLTVSGAQIPSGVNFQLLFSASNSLAASGLITLQSAGTNRGTVTIFPTINPGAYSGMVTYTLGAPITLAPLASQSFQLSYGLS